MNTVRPPPPSRSAWLLNPHFFTPFLTTCNNFTCGWGWGVLWCCCQCWGICSIRKFSDHQCHKMYHQTCHQFHHWIYWFTEIANLKTCHKLHHRIWWFTEKAPILSQNLSLNVVIHFIYHQIWWEICHKKLQNNFSKNSSPNLSPKLSLN